MLKEYIGCESSISHNYCATVRYYDNEFDHSFLIKFSKKKEWPETCI